MSRKKKAPGVLLYDSWFLAYEFLSDEDAGKILKAIGDHIAGREVNLPDHLMKSTEKMFMEIDENRQAYDARCEQNRANVNKRYTNEVQENTDVVQNDTNVLQNGTVVIQSNTNTNTNPNSTPKSKSNTKVTNVTSKESEPKGSPKKGGLSLDQFNSVMSEFPVFEENKDLQKSLVSYLHMRKKRSGTSAVKTVDSLRKLINKAIKLGQGDPQNMIEIFDNSTAMSYQGLFVPDEQKARQREKSVTDIINNFGMEEDEASGR